jgi:hypothetical protein
MASDPDCKKRVTRKVTAILSMALIRKDYPEFSVAVPDQPKAHTR